MILDLLVNLGFSTMNILPIYLIASLGGFLSQRVGVYDISMEGNMTLGAVLSIMGYFISGSPWIGLLFGFIGGLVLGFILATLAVRYKLDQIVIGFGLWFFSGGLATFFYKLFVHSDLPTKGFSSLSKIYGLDSELSMFWKILDFDVIFYLSIFLLLTISFVLYKTKLGLYMRAVGENPAAADAAGIKIYMIRFLSVILGAGLVGISGAYLGVDFMQGFIHGMVAGRGWVSFAIIIFARWRPLNIFWGCILFAGVSGLQIRLQLMGITLPSELLTALPYIATVIALTIIMWKYGKAGMPSALGVPYSRE